MRILKEPEERRNEIINTAENLFFSKGYIKTTINDILNEIGIAKGTFYYYFKSKEEVMDAIIMKIVNNDVTIAKKIAHDSKIPTIDKLFQILLAQKPKNNVNKSQMIEQFHLAENAEMHQKSLVLTIKYLAPTLTEVVNQGIEENIFVTDYPKETVEFLIVSSIMLFDKGLFEWQPSDLLQRAKAFIVVMEKSLGAKKGSFNNLLDVMLN